MSDSNTPQFNKISFVVNPTSFKGTGRAVFEKHLPEIRRLLGDRLHKIYFTKSAGGGERKARLAVQEGADLVVSCGGDGTLHEVLNGVMDAETRKAQCAIALFPIGTGNDFAKAIHLTEKDEKFAIKYDRIIRTIADGAAAKIDIGHLKATDEDNPDVQRECFFINEASFGISSSVMKSVNSGRVIINRDFTFGFHAVWQQFTYYNKDVQVRFDDHDPRSGLQQVTAVFNGQYFGSGMQGGAGSSLQDGKFTVTTLHDVSALEAISVVSKFYKARHNEHPKVTVDEASVVEARTVRPEDEVYIETDGELFGRLPATMTNLPRTVWFVVPRDWADKI